SKMAKSADKKRLKDLIKRIRDYFDEKEQKEAAKIFLGEELKDLMLKYPDRSLNSIYNKNLEVIVDRVKARYAAWYEIFPRSQGTEEGKSATFKDCEARLPEIKRMGFDVIYFPPIHPIGQTNRKGPNNTLNASPNDPGCPYAIGNINCRDKERIKKGAGKNLDINKTLKEPGNIKGFEPGGHKDIEPLLGTFEDFENFRKKAEELGIEIAIDFAINCSPDHPYVRDHPDWFYKRPDGTIKYAENPPKKYEDIYPLNFNCEDREGLWYEMLSFFIFWAERGVKIFRVDNPHTKPVAFWEWVIFETQKRHPDTMFLSEAFTRPKMMKALAKAGFTQSYTYFTWRNFKEEIIEYFTELTTYPMSEYFRGNLFTNTPDILPAILQEGGRPAFKMRAVLAATLSSVYGIYSGFELCEGTPMPGKEEYINSEKYEYKVWDWDREGNIKDYITQINTIRRNNEALQHYNNLEFYNSDNDNILFYGKLTEDLSNIIFVVVNLDPFQKHESFIYVPIDKLNIEPDETYQVHDLLNNERYLWKGSQNFVSLDPTMKTAHILKIRKWHHRENDFDYFM
ncbi:MAG: alpha-amylase family glycosyl hydrolase, partial [Cyanobacteriota bacterium]